VPYFSDKQTYVRSWLNQIHQEAKENLSEEVTNAEKGIAQTMLFERWEGAKRCDALIWRKNNFKAKEAIDFLKWVLMQCFLAHLDQKRGGRRRKNTAIKPPCSRHLETQRYDTLSMSWFILGGKLLLLILWSHRRQYGDNLKQSEKWSNWADVHVWRLETQIIGTKNSRKYQVVACSTIGNYERRRWVKKRKEK
jgi:hypothetical protein